MTIEVKYSTSDYDYTTITAEWKPPYTMMGELPDDTLRTTNGYDDSLDQASETAATEIHEWISEKLSHAQAFTYTTTDDDFTRTVTHEWSGEHLTVEVWMGDFCTAPSCEISYDGISETAGESMDDTDLLDQMIMELEKIVDADGNCSLIELIDSSISENYFEALWDNCIRFDENIWYDRNRQPLNEDLITELSEDYERVLQELAEDDALYIPAAHSIDEDGAIMITTVEWWEGETSGTDTTDRWNQLPSTPVERLKVLDYLEKSQNILLIPESDSGRKVSERKVTYRRKSNCNEDQVRQADGYRFELEMIADAIYFSEAA